LANILIATQVNDIHALAVTMVLRERGHRVLRYFGSDFPTQVRQSVRVSRPGIVGWQMTTTGESMDLQAVDVVWHRRVTVPHLPADILHPADVASARQELYAFHESFWGNIAISAQWVNSRQGWLRASSKLQQLRAAAALGIDIPETLISNDPSDIRAFLQDHAGQGTIYKLFAPASWAEDGETLVAVTNRITDADLPEDSVLQATPGIYQALEQKDHELRITIMGHHITAMRMDRQRHSAVIDWRYGDFFAMDTRIVELDPGVAESYRKLMKDLGIVFGVIDAIVTPDGRRRLPQYHSGPGCRREAGRLACDRLDRGAALAHRRHDNLGQLIAAYARVRDLVAA
jgi:hypothetical protein